MHIFAIISGKPDITLTSIYQTDTYSSPRISYYLTCPWVEEGSNINHIIARAATPIAFSFHLRVQPLDNNRAAHVSHFPLNVGSILSFSFLQNHYLVASKDEQSQ